MGTNYYAVRNRPSLCEPIHIGKSSGGWLFLFQDQQDTWRDPPVVWHSYPEVLDWLKKYTIEQPDYVILNEYDQIIPFTTFVQMVERKQADEHCLSNPDNFKYSKNVDGYRFSDGDFS